MYFKTNGASKDGIIPAQWLHKQASDGAIIACSNLESFFVTSAGLPVFNISGEDLRILSYQYGYAEYERPAAVAWGPGTQLMGPGKLTGRVFYQGKTPVFPPAGSTAVSIDYAALAAALIAAGALDLTITGSARPTPKK